MSHYYMFKEENLTEDQKQRLYDLTMELGPRSDVSYREHIAEIRADAIKNFAKALAEIRAEAVKEFVAFLPAYSYGINAELEKEANKYAAKVRQGGE